MIEQVRHFDVIVVGGGPAGLSAALILGRCRRRVLVCDAGRPRNFAAREMHGFLGRDCSDPADLREAGRAHLARYETVTFRSVTVVEALREEDAFRATFDGGGEATSRKLLLATGVRDDLPEVPGFAELYGTSAHHCPYCDGWEWRDRAVAVYGRGPSGASLALELLGWSADVVLFTDCRAELDPAERNELARNGIAIREDRVAAFEGENGLLQAVRLANGEVVPREVLFFCTSSKQTCPIAASFGCTFEDGKVSTGGYEQTHVPGLYVAGDASRHAGLAIVAAAEGARAAFAINMELLKEDRR
jgi:thioredoxin reductase